MTDTENTDMSYRQNANTEYLSVTPSLFDAVFMVKYLNEPQTQDVAFDSQEELNPQKVL